MLIDNPRKVFPLTDSRLGDECDDGPLEIEVAIQAHRVSVHLPVFNAFTVFFAFPGFDPTFPLPSEVGKWQTSLKHCKTHSQESMDHSLIIILPSSH
jgi:hypothetical protein